MNSILSPLRKWFAPPRPIPAGMYHYQSPPDDPRNYRLHLRVESDGRAVLIVNASTVLHLNETAAEYAYYLVQNLPIDQAARLTAQRYQVTNEQAAQDYQDFIERVLTLVEQPDLDPVTFLDFNRQTPYSKISAPYRLDCALTYRLPAGADPASAPEKRVTRELDTHEWITVLDKAWQRGIPQVVFTGGEPTLRDDLPQLIAHAEANGQVSGLITDGLKLNDPAYFESLLSTGLDHLLIVLEPGSEQSWQAVRRAIDADIYTVVHFTVNEQNSPAAQDILKRLAGLGVKAISLTAVSESLYNAMLDLRESAAFLGIDLVWDLPAPYSGQNPISLETQADQPPAGAGRAWLYVEPDGDVLPAQGMNQILGNILSDSWEKLYFNK
ncbi:MAG: radical SAM protein [Chloroflexi bacterium]|nr:radical SAM protein [Chloroflexota bacterium]